MGNINVTKTDSDALNLEHHGRTELYIDPVDTEALREYFQAERDKEFGWWRASPEYVVKPSTGENVIGSRSVIVLNERLGVTIPVWEGYDISSGYGIAASAYFDAHPKPKPWHSAKPGEVWLITVKKPEPMIATAYGTFTAELSEYALNDEAIITGSRIYPEEAGETDE